MNKKSDQKKIEELLKNISETTSSYNLEISRLNWKLARLAYAYREKHGSAASRILATDLEKIGIEDNLKGYSHSKIEKLFIIGHFSQDDLVRLGIPDVDPFVFLQHKSSFIDHKSKALKSTEEASAVLAALQRGASDFELRKIRKKGTRY